MNVSRACQPIIFAICLLAAVGQVVTATDVLELAAR